MIRLERNAKKEESKDDEVNYMNMKKDTKVLSARVPLDLHKTISARAKGMGLSTSAYLTKMVKSSIMLKKTIMKALETIQKQ